MRNLWMHAVGPLAALALTACTPSHDWRDTALEPAPSLHVLLPCKPDRAERAVPIPGGSVAVRMAGCAVAGRTFTVARAEAPDAAAAAALLARWRQATRAGLGLGDAAPGAGVFAPAGSTPLPGALREALVGGPVPAEAAWFARAPAAGPATVYQALLLGPVGSGADAATAADTFFTSLRVQP